MPYKVEIHVKTQTLLLYDGHILRQTYPISTALKGVGCEKGSEKTPLGHHIIRAKIGHHLPKGAVLLGRRPTGELYSEALAAQYPNRDWILSRILWLSGLEKGLNRLGSVDTMQRYIYIHGVPDTLPMGVPLSHGCIRMHNESIIELFESVPVGTTVIIK